MRHPLAPALAELAAARRARADATARHTAAATTHTVTLRRRTPATPMPAAR